jgi:hypothetical protein
MTKLFMMLIVSKCRAKLPVHGEKVKLAGLETAFQAPG